MSCFKKDRAYQDLHFLPDRKTQTRMDSNFECIYAYLTGIDIIVIQFERRSYLICHVFYRLSYVVDVLIVNSLVLNLVTNIQK